jgi:hypothetical protein
VTSSSPINVSPPTSTGGAIGPSHRVDSAYAGSHHKGLSSPYASATWRNVSVVGSE